MKEIVLEFQRLNDSSDEQISQAAAVLLAALKDFTLAWPDFPSAMVEVRSFLQSYRLAFLALEDKRVVGWIGAIRHTDHLWELHSLVVDPGHQRKGIGRALVEILEIEARKQGASTIYLGTDDEFGGTTIFGKDLYPDVLSYLRELQPVTNHPYLFYQGVGYTVVGVIPDASGAGRHDILMAKRIGSSGCA